jgi:hypothetical protein
MAVPANIRYQAPAPFPSLVTSTGPIGITKVNGIWTVSLNMAQLQVGVVDNSPTKFLLLWDSAINFYSRVSFASVLSTLSAFLGAQTRVTTTPYTVSGTDRVLNCNVAGPLTINLPAASTRGGLAITVKDVSGNASVNNITVVPTGGETIDGQANIVLRANYGSVTIVPFTDGVGVGYFIAL